MNVSVKISFGVPTQKCTYQMYDNSVFFEEWSYVFP